jgi:sterol carrier protein 2
VGGGGGGVPKPKPFPEFINILNTRYEVYTKRKQVKNVKYGLTHNIGLGGAAIVGIFKLGFNTAQQTAVTSSVTNSSDLSTTTSLHKSGKFFDQIQSGLKEEGPGMVKKVNAIIGFQVACANNQTISYVIDLKNGSGSVFVNNAGNNKDFIN